MDWQKKQAGEEVWDPEKAYARERRGRLRLLLFILLVIAAGAVWILSVQQDTGSMGDVPLKGSMTFEEADQKMREAGYEPYGAARYQGNIQSQEYGEREVCGCSSFLSVLEAEEGKDGGLRIGHAFLEQAGHSSENPGEIYNRLKKELTKRMGTPKTVEEAGTSYCQWNRSDRSCAILGYLWESYPVLFFIYPR